jgi:hypothetical protein
VKQRVDRTIKALHGKVPPALIPCYSTPFGASSRNCRAVCGVTNEILHCMSEDLPYGP